MTDEHNKEIECVCPACGIEAARGEAKRCIQKRCPSCGAAMADKEELGRTPSGSNVPSP